MSNNLLFILDNLQDYSDHATYFVETTLDKELATKIIKTYNHDEIIFICNDFEQYATPMKLSDYIDAYTFFTLDKKMRLEIIKYELLALLPDEILEEMINSFVANHGTFWDSVVDEAVEKLRNTHKQLQGVK